MHTIAHAIEVRSPCHQSATQNNTGTTSMSHKSAALEKRLKIVYSADLSEVHWKRVPDIRHLECNMSVFGRKQIRTGEVIEIERSYSSYASRRVLSGLFE